MDSHALEARLEFVADSIRQEIFLPLPAELKGQVTVFGGAIRDTFLGSEVADYDLMVVDREAEAKLITFLDQWAERASLTPRHANYLREGKKVQLLREIYFPADAKLVASLSDFTICCCAMTEEAMGLHPQFFVDLAEKRLRLNRVTFPLATLDRLQKFAARGFAADHATILSLAHSLKQADLNDRATINLQLPSLPLPMGEHSPASKANPSEDP